MNGPKLERIDIDDLRVGDEVKINPRSDVVWVVREDDLGGKYLGSSYTIRNVRKDMKLFLVKRAHEKENSNG